MFIANMKFDQPIESRNMLDKMHWSIRAKKSKDWKILVRAHARERTSKPTELRYVKIISVRGKIMDDDNFIGGCKSLRDALVFNNLLYDDSPKWCVVTYHQVATRTIKHHTHVLVSKEPIP